MLHFVTAGLDALHFMLNMHTVIGWSHHWLDGCGKLTSHCANSDTLNVLGGFLVILERVWLVLCFVHWLLYVVEL